MNIEKQFVVNGTTSTERTCLICGKPADRGNVSETWIEDSTYVLTHNICHRSILALVDGKSKDTISGDHNLSGFIEEIDGQPVLIRRDFESNSPFVLGYFAFSKGNPRYAHELAEWLKTSGIKLSNPSDYIRKLTLASKLARVPDETGKLRFIITELGHKELMQAVRENDPP